MKTVVCFGASLTAGTVSYNYLDLLSARPALSGFRFVNHGVNSDLAWNGLQRLDAALAERPDYFTILIGTNDVNATLSDRNRLRYLEFNKLPTEPTLDWYEETMTTIVRRVRDKSGARVALLSLAVIGEDLAHEANRRMERYNEAIRRVAAAEKTAYLPLNETMISYLHAHEGDRAALPPQLAYRDGLHNVGNAVALHHSGLTWDEVSQRNGLLVTTDTLHLNSVGAGMVADLIEGWLHEETESLNTNS